MPPLIHVSANFVVMVALEAAIQKNTRHFSYDWMAGSSPAMTLGRKFANVFIASSASGNIGVIKSRKGEALSGILTL